MKTCFKVCRQNNIKKVYLTQIRLNEANCICTMKKKEVAANLFLLGDYRGRSDPYYGTFFS